MGSAPAPGAANGALAVRNASLGIDVLNRPHAFCSARGAPNGSRRRLPSPSLNGYGLPHFKTLARLREHPLVQGPMHN